MAMAPRSDDDHARRRLGVVALAVVNTAWDRLERFAADPTKALLVDIVLGLMIAALALAFTLISLQTHTALCTFRADLEKRVEATEKFLHDNPHLTSLRFGSAVVTRGQLLVQARTQRATLKSLDELNC